MAGVVRGGGARLGGAGTTLGVLGMILLCFGTRPEAIKLGPVADALTTRGVPWAAVASGQHTDLLAGTPAETTFAGAHSLGLLSDGDLTRWRRNTRAAFGGAFAKWRPRAVVVQGDTMSALAAAEAAAQHPILLAHVEAGVRSHNRREPWPEEEARERIGQLASIHYAPTATAVGNLAAERVRGRVLLTGNTGVDALAAAPHVAGVGVAGAVLVTLHRRELRDRGNPHALLETMIAAMAVTKRRFLWLVHPAMEVYVPRALPTNIWRLTPLLHNETINVLRAASAVLTDSGGLVEEATTLGIPTAILRDANDRPEAEAAGVARRFDRADVAVAVRWVVAPPAVTPSAVFGDGRASARIAADLASLEGLT